MPVVVRGNERKAVSTNEDLKQALADGFIPLRDEVNLTDRGGKPISVKSSDLEFFLDRGFEPESIRLTAERAVQKDREREFGGTAETIRSFGEGALRGLTLGVSDVALSLADDERDIEARKAINPIASTVGEIGGLIAPTILSGGATAGVSGARAGGATARLLARTPAAIASKIGVSAAARAGAATATLRGGGLLSRAVSRAAPAVVGGAAEGGLIGIGQGVSHLALSDDPITAESVVSTIGSKALFGAATGGVVGGAVTGLGAAVQSASQRITRAATRAEKAAQAATAATGKATSRAAKAAARADARAAVRSAQSEFSTAALRTEFSSAMQSVKAGKDISISSVKTLDAAESLINAPGKVGQRAATDIVKAADGAGVKFTENELKAVAGDLGIDTLPKAGSNLDNVVKAHAGLKLLGRQGVATGPASARSGVSSLIRRSVQGGISGGVVGATVEAVAATGGGIGTGILAGATGRFIGGLAQKVLRPGGVSAARAGALDRISKAITGAVKAGKILKPAAIPATSQILNSVEFGKTVGPGKTNPSEKRSDRMATSFRKRARELSEAVGNQAQTKQRIRESLKPVTAQDINVGAQTEQLAMRVLQFLHGKLPKNPGLGSAVQPGIDRYRPSDVEIAKFGRYVRTANDPMSALEDLKAGRISQESVEVLRDLYPEMYQKMRVGILERVGELRENLPYDRRIQMSIFFQVPVDSVMRPEFVLAMQAQFAGEEGTGGGQQAPSGSLKSISVPDETPAQRLASE